MKKSRFTESQIFSILKEVDSGMKVEAVCRKHGISNATYYRPERDWRKQDAAVIDAINNKLKRSPQAGFWKCYGRLRHKGYPFNHKRVYRVYCQMGLNFKRRINRVLPKRIVQPLAVIAQANHQWALDFMHDSWYCGKRFRTPNFHLDESGFSSGKLLTEAVIFLR